jgi:hypothetical protein
MPGEALPPPVQQFVSEHLSSVEQMEVLQLLAANPGTEWTAQAVYKVVLSTVESIEQALEKFAGSGIIEKSQGPPAIYRFVVKRGSPAVIEELCRFYKEMPVRVITAIYKDRNTVQQFADAFKFTRKP